MCFSEIIKNSFVNFNVIIENPPTKLVPGNRDDSVGGR